MFVRPRIALIHATPFSMDPIKATMASAWPEAEIVNILEDSLSIDRAASPDMTPEITDRVLRLAWYAQDIGSHGVLFTCSAFGTAIEQAALLAKIPILKPNEALFEAAIRNGKNSAMLYTFPPSCEGMQQEFVEQANKIDPEARLTCFLVEGASEAMQAGDAETHNRLVAEKAASIGEFDAIVLAHFSTSRARAAVQAITPIPVFTSPDAAVAKLRALVEF